MSNDRPGSADNGASDQPRPPSEESTVTAHSDVSVPSRIGPYRILQKLGEGGMGIVYEAEQESPIRRRVALKIVKWGMDTKHVIARFDAERQALALMNHPNVARVFDAGATEHGRPYFVMELVKGIPITEHCDRHRLTTDERLGLFVEACAGIQHAHQKGIIHRDIKPSNILVAVEGEKAVLKIIDFGVARATEQRLTEHTLFTEIGQIVGTPEYMSPEQAEMSHQDIDTRTDVYSLGVLLYELLVGALPFDPADLRRAGFDEIRRRIREEEPSRPSSKVTTLKDISSDSARNRRTDPRSLARRLRGDLDWITMRALEKDRTRRYGSATELSQDIERHLRDDTVAASPPSAAYRLGKFARRHKVGFVMSLTLTAVVFAGLVGTAVGLLRAQREAVRAELNSAARGLLQYMLTPNLEDADKLPMRREPEPPEAFTVEEALNRGVARLHASRLEPIVEAELCEILGSLHSLFGYHDEAESLLERSIEILRQEFGPEHDRTLRALILLLNNFLYQDRFEAAEPIWRQVIGIETRVYGSDDVRTLTRILNLGTTYLAQEQYDLAEPLLLEAAETLERVAGPDDPKTSRALNNLGELYKLSHRFDEAEPIVYEVLETRRRSLGDNHPQTLIGVFNLGDFYRERKMFAKAEPLFAEALDGFQRVFGEEHPYTALTMTAMADVLVHVGRTEEAESLATASYERSREQFGEDHWNTLDTVRVLVDIYESRGDETSAAEWRSKLSTNGS